MSSWDQGNVLPAALGAALTAAYSASMTSAALFGGRAGQIDLFLDCTTVGGSPIASVTAKLQAQDRDGKWYDVLSKREDTSAVNIEHTFVLGAAPQTNKTLMIICTEAGGSLAQRVRVHADAIGAPGDVVIGNVTFA